ncbi:MAG: ComF family protein [Candidatus Aphodosoma sp.]
MKLLQWWNTLWNFCIDRKCTVCGQTLPYGRYCVCSQCEADGIFDNPRLKFRGNILEKRLYGLTSCKAASALMPYLDDNGAKAIVHRLKYSNNRLIARQIGEAMAVRIMQSQRYGTIDWVVPVPLHPARLKQRGYNQSALIAEAIGKTLNAKVDTDNLYRIRNNESQTRRHRLDRMENVRNLFALHDTQLFADSGVLLVDDVFTTGSTIIECCKALDRTPGVQLYVYTIAAGE